MQKALLLFCGVYGLYRFCEFLFLTCKSTVEGKPSLLSWIFIAIGMAILIMSMLMPSLMEKIFSFLAKKVKYGVAAGVIGISVCIVWCVLYLIWGNEWHFLKIFGMYVFIACMASVAIMMLFLVGRGFYEYFFADDKRDSDAMEKRDFK